MPDERAKVRQFNWRKRQRNLKRKQVTYWLDTDVNDELNRLAKEYGGPKQDAINAVLMELLSSYKSQNKRVYQSEDSGLANLAKVEKVNRDEVPSVSEWEKTCQLIRSMWPKMTYLQIAETLNREGISTKTGRGRWHVSTVKRVIEQK